MLAGDYVSVCSEGTVAYEIHGILPSAYREELPQANLVFAAYEFGTISEQAVFNAIRADHWLHTYGDLNSAKAKRIMKLCPIPFTAIRLFGEIKCYSKHFIESIKH